MKVVLAYNVIGSVSGEKTFFENISKALAGRGIEVAECAVPGLNYPILDKIEFYSRFPMLATARLKLKGFGDRDVLHFLNSSLCPAALHLRNQVKVATVHHFAPMYYRVVPPNGLFANAAESFYCRYIRILEKRAFNSLDCLVATTNNLQSCIAKEYGLDKSKIRTIYPGIDVSYFNKISRTDLKSEYGCGEAIAYFGRLHERSKGVSHLIRAMKVMKRKNSRLLIVGDGPDRAGYERLVSELGIRDSVLFLGGLGFDEKSRIQKSADVVVVPSAFELFGTVFAESLACGTPVVAFDMPFWKEIYGDAGLFVKPGDPAALAEGIGKVLDDRDLRKKLISKGKEKCMDYDLKKVVSSYVRLYEELV